MGLPPSEEESELVFRGGCVEANVGGIDIWFWFCWATMALKQTGLLCIIRTWTGGLNMAYPAYHGQKG
jgi:hypothetical protein